MQISRMKLITDRNRERLILVIDINEAKDPKNTGIRFYHFHLVLQQFVECADLPCKRTRVLCIMVLKLVANSEE